MLVDRCISINVIGVRSYAWSVHLVNDFNWFLFISSLFIKLLKFCFLAWNLLRLCRDNISSINFMNCWGFSFKVLSVLRFRCLNLFTLKIIWFAISSLNTSWSNWSFHSLRLMNWLNSPFLFPFKNRWISNSLVFSLQNCFIGSWIIYDGTMFSNRILSRSFIFISDSIIINYWALLRILIILSNKCLIWFCLIDECIFDKDWISRPKLRIDWNLLHDF